MTSVNHETIRLISQGPEFQPCGFVYCSRDLGDENLLFIGDMPFSAETMAQLFCELMPERIGGEGLQTGVLRFPAIDSRPSWGIVRWRLLLDRFGELRGIEIGSRRLHAHDFFLVLQDCMYDLWPVWRRSSEA